MRVLELVEIREPGVDGSDQLPEYAQRLWELPSADHPYPLPEFSHTEPHLALNPHTGMGNGLDKTIYNYEEIKPRKIKSELSLVAFTLLSQMAAGMAVLSIFSGPLSLPIIVTLGGLIGVSGLISLLHLGRPLNAWRALNHLKKSWLSREILMFGSFGASWLLCLALPGMGKLPLAVFGIGLVYSMAQVYRLRSIPAWDTKRTLLAFIVSAIVLGGLGLGVANAFGSAVIKIGYLIVSGIGLMGALLLSLTDRDQAYQTASRLRFGSILLALVGVVTIFLVPIRPGGGW